MYMYCCLVCIWASRKMRLYTGFTGYIRWYLETILVASRNNHFNAQISQTDKVLFCLGDCRLSAENGEHESLKSVTKVRHPKILNWKKRATKPPPPPPPPPPRKQKKKKKKTASEDKIHDTRLCISMNQSVDRGSTQWGKGCIRVSVACFNCSTSLRSLKCSLPTPV